MMGGAIGPRTLNGSEGREAGLTQRIAYCANIRRPSLRGHEHANPLPDRRSAARLPGSGHTLRRTITFHK